MKRILSGVMAGICILLGCAVYLACDIKYIGAVLFSVALLCICWKDYALFTGKVGCIAETPNQDTVNLVLLALLGNLLGIWFFGTLLRTGMPSLVEKAVALCDSKKGIPVWEVFMRGYFCGILMYLAVSVFRDRKSIAGILVCIPAFILSGFEHCIADLGYFTIAGIVSLPAFLFIWMVLLGNALGGLTLPFLSRFLKEE